MSQIELWVVSGVEGVLLLLFCMYITWHYAALKRTPLYVIILTVLSWYLAFMIIFLIPIDIYTTKQMGASEGVITTLWSFNYWSVFILNWFILPLLQEYLAAGDFSRKERVMRSLRNNIPLMLIYFITFIIIVVCLAVTESGRIALQNDGILGCVIGLSLVFSLLTIVLLLGYGLVEIPISYFKLSSNKAKLEHYQCKVAEYDEQLKEKAKKVKTLEDIIAQVIVEADLNIHKDTLKKDVEQFHDTVSDISFFRLSFTPSVSDKAGREFRGVLDYNKLVRLRNRYIYSTTDVIRLLSFRREAIENAILIQDIIDSKGKPNVSSLFLQGSLYNWANKDQRSCINRVIAKIQQIWLVYLRPISTLLLSLIFGSLSLVILYAQIANILNFEHTLIYDIVTAPEDNSFLVSNIFCLIPLMYLVYASNFGLFQLKVSNIYALHRNHHTDPSCLLFSGMLLMRMSVPISYNFLQLTHMKEAAIYTVMGSVEYVSFLGQDFNRWVFPICLLLMVFLTLFRIYGRLLGCLGLKKYSFDEDDQHEQIEDGKYIIEQYKNEVLISDGSSASTRQGSVGYEVIKDMKAVKVYNKINQLDESVDLS